MKTILTPVDFSPSTRHVVDAAVSLAQSIGASIVLQHSVQPPMITTDYGIGLDVVQETIQVSEKAARKQLDHLTRTIAEKGLAVTSVMDTGTAAPNILEQAQKLAPAYIVLGTHGHTAFYDLLVGSTTHAVLKQAACPVLIVPTPKPPPAPAA